MKTHQKIIVLVIFITASHQTEYFEEIDEKTFFQQEDKVLVTHERVDIVLNINLKGIAWDIARPCILTKALHANETTSVSQRVYSQLQQLCSAEQDRWRRMEALLLDKNGPTARTRPQRFIVTTILSSLAAGVAGMIWGSSGSQRTDRIEDHQAKIVAQLQEDEHQIKLQEEHVREMSEVINNREELLKLQGRQVEASMFLIAAFQNQLRDTTRLTAALEQLVLHKKLVPGLVEPEPLKRKLDQLSKELREEGLVMTTREYHQLFANSLSFGTFSSGTARIILHIPVHREGEEFASYRLVPVPFAVTGSNEFGQVAVGTEDTLVVAQDRAQYFVSTTKDLGTCFRATDWISCSSVDALRTPEHPSCLWALFTGNTTMTRDWCRITTTPSHSQSWKIARNTFLVFHPTKRTMTVTCPAGKTAASRFRGTTKVALTRGCKASNGQLTLWSSPSTRH